MPLIAVLLAYSSGVMVGFAGDDQILALLALIPGSISGPIAVLAWRRA